MNEFAGFAHPRRAGGFHAMVRLASNAKAEPIKEPGGKNKLFPTKEEALEEVIKHLLAYFNGHLCRDGEIMVAGSKFAAANALFKPKEVAHG